MMCILMHENRCVAGTITERLAKNRLGALICSTIWMMLREYFKAIVFAEDGRSNL